MARSVTHRGPDDEGFFQTVAGTGPASLAWVTGRLSIIDLDTGHQPMSNEDGSIRIVFNGEIYNYPALRRNLYGAATGSTHPRTRKTVVHAYEEYGDRCLERFRGMFAFRRLGRRRERMLLARDRFGKKPLFLYGNGGLLLFASEIKAILACPCVDRTLNRGRHPGIPSVPLRAGTGDALRKNPETLSGCLAVWENGNPEGGEILFSSDRFPRNASPLPPDPIGSSCNSGRVGPDPDDFRRAVWSVPIRGIDSSTVVGLMARHSALPVRTFSVGFAKVPTANSLMPVRSQSGSPRIIMNSSFPGIM